MKKSISVFLCISLFCMFYGGVSVNAEEVHTEGYYTYSVSNGVTDIKENAVIHFSVLKN